MNSANPPQRIVIVGGGVAGIEIATALGRRWKHARSTPSITLVDRDSAHIWKPMLHMIAAGTRDISQQQIPFLAQARAAGFDYQPGEMEGLDRDAKEISLAPIHAPDGMLLVPARRIGYDLLILAVGSEANDFGTTGVEEHCQHIDSRLEADAFNQAVRMRMLQSLAKEQPVSIAIVGGGATGVELAAELVQLTEIASGYGAQALKSCVEISLIEAGPRLLPAFPHDISQATKARLQSLGVRVMTDTSVDAATQDGFLLGNGEMLPAALRVWAAGVKAPPFLKSLAGLEATKTNQLVVGPSLQTTRDPAIFAIGDCASLTPQGAERPLPPTAQVAHQQAQHLIRHLPALLSRGKPPPAFVYRDFGALVSLADYDAFGSLGKFGLLKGATFRGTLAQISHAMLYRSHQARIYGFWRGGLIWLVDRLNMRLRSTIRLD